MPTLTHTYTDPVVLENGVALTPGQPLTVDEATAAQCVALAPLNITVTPMKKEK